MREKKIQKKGFIFSFLALFIAVFIFAYASMYLFNGSFEAETTYKNSRIGYIDKEIIYFKTIYIKDAISYSLYTTLDALLNYSKSNPQIYKNLSQNYTYFNQLIYEGLINGSFNGQAQPQLSSKNLTFFISDFSDNFNSNYKGNFHFNILNLNIYEKNPYYVNGLFYSNISVSMLDNLSSWNILYNFDISIPISSLRDPDFLLKGGFDYNIDPIESHGSSVDWDLISFNNTLNRGYSVVSLESDHKYTLGKSFLRRFLNISEGSYKNTLGFWSFDYDEDMKEVFDSSGYFSLGTHLGNTRLALSFDNFQEDKDLSDYNNTINLNGGIYCLSSGVINNSCSFDGTNDYIEILNDDSLIFDKNSDFSISFWFRGKNISTIQNILSKGTSNYSYQFQITPSGNVFASSFDGIDGVEINFLNLTSNLSDWNNLVYIKNKNLYQGYLNGFLVDSKEAILNHSSNNQDLYIGVNNSLSSYFQGSIDEFAIYSKALSSEEVANLYKNKKIKLIDYVETYHGKGIQFDGIDDYLNLSNDIFNPSPNQLAIELWFTMNSSQNYSNLLNLPLDSLNQNLISVYINNSNQTFFQTIHNNGNNILIANQTIPLKKSNYLVISFNGTQKYIYLNSKLIANKTINSPLNNSNQNLIIGFEKKINSSFNGIIDEIKIYNETLSNKKIKENYYNYDSNSKGCCNYVTLINPNKMGYNSSSYNGLVSYNSNLFYDYYTNSKDYNMTLWRIINITSATDTSKNYYNFMLDDCLISAFNIDAWGYESNVNQTYVKLGSYNSSCSNFVSAGIY